ncbi:MAG: hypothetical protein ACUVS7_02790 [Bryobacteraceae bacterium]
MNWKGVVWSVLIAAAVPAWGTEELARRVRELELQGRAAEARRMLESAIRAEPRNVETLAVYAAFLDERRDPEAVAVYERVATLAPEGSPWRIRALGRLTVLQLLHGRNEEARQSLEAWKRAGGRGWELRTSGPTKPLPMGTVTIPGPLESFARMAAFSPEMPPEEILLALARNIITNGYQALSGNEGMEQTEYLKLVVRYLSQARELEKLAGTERVIRIEACESPQTGELLRILGFRMRGGCGSDVVLETVNATRAFLSMDSGFPLAELEQALRTNRPFVYDFKPSTIPVLYSAEYWLSAREKQSGEFIDMFLNDPSLCRLYLGLAKLDPETAEEVRKALPVTRIRAFAHVFDFFGGMFQIRNGKVSVPGGARAAGAWADLVGAPPERGVEFLDKLVSKDDGWLASYFDALSRIEGPTLDYLTEPGRLKRFYAALRGRVTSPGPARPVFRSNTDLMLLTTRLRIVGGQPVIPGGLEVWKTLFTQHPSGKYDGKLTRAAATWKEPDDLIEALFGLSRKAVENEPLRIFLSISDVERRREKPLEAATVQELAFRWKAYGAQYPLFSETGALSDATIVLFLDTADKISRTGNNELKANTAGMMQALAGLWQVLVRQRLIPEARADETLAALLKPFAAISNTQLLCDAGRAGVMELLRAAGVDDLSNPQDRMMDLLAGALKPSDEETHQALLGEMLRAFEAQRLVSLKLLFDLDDHLEALSKGEPLNAQLLGRLAARVSDLNLPKASLTAAERNTMAFGYFSERHIDMQRKLNLRAVVARAQGNAEKLKEARGLLAPLLRDTLVGMLYIHYAPPGAQLLYTNPLFARSHDFIGIQGSNQTWKQTEVLGMGWPSSAGGRLVGSLANLPYALAEAEQNFLIPSREQALIWGDLVPQLLVSARLPRFWNVTPQQLHYLGLHLRLGETVIVESALRDELREQAMRELERLAPPARVEMVSRLLASGRLAEAFELIMPSELYFLGAQAAARQWPTTAGFGEKIRLMAAALPSQCNARAVSELAGTPKPTLANSHRPELLQLRTFPTLMGYSSRILAESWESHNLFFAALADELGLRPAQLNLMLPEWTVKTVEAIFATHLEDWPALLRAMRRVAEQVRAEARRSQAAEVGAGAGF